MEELRRLMLREPYLEFIAVQLDTTVCLLKGLIEVGLLTDTKVKRFVAVNKLNNLSKLKPWNIAVDTIAKQYNYSTRYVRNFIDKYDVHVKGSNKRDLNINTLLMNATNHIKCNPQAIHRLYEYGLLDLDVIKRYTVTKEYELLLESDCPNSSALTFLHGQYGYTKRYIRELPVKFNHLNNYNFTDCIND